MNEIIKILQNYFTKIPISKAWIFGSYARGEQTSDSDIDILITYEKGFRPGVFGMVKIIEELEELVGKKIDLVEENQLYPRIAKEIETQKIMIYERNHS